MTALQPLAALQIQLKGMPLPLSYGSALSELRIQQRLSCPAQCELTFLNTDGTLGQDPLWALGNDVTVQLGEPPHLVFQGKITALDYLYEPNGEQKIRVRGYDGLQTLRQSFSVGAYVQVTTADLVRELVASQGWTLQAPNPGPLWPRLIQYQHSNLDFLVNIAERSGLYLSLRGDELWLLPLAGAASSGPASSAISLTLGEMLFEVHLALNSQTAGPAVSVSGWDPLRAEPHAGNASRAATGRSMAVPASGVVGVGELPLEGLCHRTFSNTVVTNDREAEAFAQATLNHQSAQSVTVWGVADGNAQLQPGAAVDIAGVAPAMTGRYVLTAVNHSITPQQGFVSEFSTVPPPLLQPSSPPSSQVLSESGGCSTILGTVTQLNDPEQLGRVQVSLPTCNEAETEWLQVLAPGAGKQKGLVSLPDVGDRVLILFLNNNPAQGIVLGGLYGADSEMDWGVEGGRTQRHSWRSHKGQQILYDDDRQLLRLENSHGSYVELLPDKVSIHAAADLTIEAPGHAIKICGKSIDFERRDD